MWLCEQLNNRQCSFTYALQMKFSFKDLLNQRIYIMYVYVLFTMVWRTRAGLCDVYVSLCVYLYLCVCVYVCVCLYVCVLLVLSPPPHHPPFVGL